LSIPAPRGLLVAFPAAALGGLLYGLVDTLRVVLDDTLPPQAGRALLLAGLDGLVLAGAGLLAGLVLWLLLRGPLGRRAVDPLGAGLLVGLTAPFLLDLGEAWFRAPAPFTQAPPLHANPLAFVGIVLGVALLALALVAVPLRRGATAASLIALALLCGRGFQGARKVPAGQWAPTAGAPNVLIVTMDTSRADYFGAYGRTDVQTPNFDGVAAQGIRFDNAFSQIPVTGPSHTTIMTGRAPWEHGNLLNGLPIDPKYATLAQSLRANGWRTAAFVSAYVLDGSLGFSRGFEVYDDDFGWLQGWDGTVPGRIASMAARNQDPDAGLERRGGRTVDQALAWLDANARGDVPFFTWVHLFDPHGPYTPPPPWDTAYYQGDPRDPAHTSMEGATNVAAYLKPSLEGITDADYILAEYAGEISYTDSQVGRLLQWLQTSGHADDTVVILVADHGESLAGDHGIWFNHGDDLYEQSTWIPWAMRLPGGAHAVAVVPDPVELTDVAPTVYALTGVAAPDTVTGHSVLNTLASQGQPHRAYARGMCFDRPVNRDLRAKGEIDKPTYRIAALRFPGTRFVDHEYGADPSEAWAIEGPDPHRSESRAPIAIPVEDELTGLTTGLFQGSSVARSQTEQSEDAIKKLQALGYMEEGE